MPNVEMSDAKAHFNELLKRVAEGEAIQITRHGVPIAKLVPIKMQKRIDPADVVRDIRSSRKGLKLGRLKMRDLINTGHRY